jgi:hypothetical protein
MNPSDYLGGSWTLLESRFENYGDTVYQVRIWKHN